MKSLKSFLRVGWLLGLAAVLWLVWRQPFGIHEIALQLSPRALIGVALFTCLANMCQGIRYYFLWPDGRIPFWRAAFLPFCVHSANILLPFRGGETVQPLFVGRWSPGQKLRSLFYWVVIDKIVEFVAMLPFLVAAAYAFDFHPAQAVLLATLVATAFAVWVARTRNPPRNLALTMLFAMLSWCFNGAVFFSLVPSVKIALGLVVATSLGSAIPGLPGAIGTFEFAFVWVCMRAGFTAPSLTALAVAAHSVSIGVTLVLGVGLGLAWGLPSKRDRIEAAAQSAAVGQQVSNFFVYTAGVLTLLAAGVLWIPQKARRRIGKLRAQRT